MEIGAERLCERGAGIGRGDRSVWRVSVRGFRAVGDSGWPFSDGTPIRALRVLDKGGGWASIADRRRLIVTNRLGLSPSG